MVYTYGMNFCAERLARLIESRRVSQAEVAKWIGVSPGVISNYLSEKKEPSYETLNWLASYFGVSIDYLFGKSALPYPAVVYEHAQAVKKLMSKRLAEMMEKEKYDIGTIAVNTGIPRNTIQRFIDAKEFPLEDELNSIAWILKTTPAFLLGTDIIYTDKIKELDKQSEIGEQNSSSSSKDHKVISGPVVYRTTHAEEDVPIVGDIHAGLPTLIFEEISEKLAIPSELLPPGEKFLVNVRGDSMEGARIFDGDLALFVKQDSVEDGEIAAVLILDTNEVTIKRVHWFDGWVALMPENDPRVPKSEQHMPTTYRADAVKILGKFKMTVRR
jgi:repressor LexA